MRCLRAGVREVVEESDWKGLREATTRSVDISKALSTSLRSGADQAPYGRVVTIFAGKGGCGRTFVAVNLAVALSAGGSRRVLLVDLDLQFGDVAIMLKLNPERSIAGGIAMAGRLDEPGLRSLVTQFRPGIDALLAPANPAQSEHVRRELVVEILDVARPLYDFIVIDTPALVTDQVLAALDMSDWLVPIVTPDLPTLKTVRLTVEMFDMLDYPKDRRLLVFNRSNTQVGLTDEDVSDAVGMPFAVHVPSSRDVPVSVNRGEPLLMTSPCTRSAGPSASSPTAARGSSRRRSNDAGCSRAASRSRHEPEGGHRMSLSARLGGANQNPRPADNDPGEPPRRDSAGSSQRYRASGRGVLDPVNDAMRCPASRRWC